MYIEKQREKKIKEREEYKNVIKKTHFFSRNAISISEKIKRYDSLSFLSFDIIEKYKEIGIGEIDEKNIQFLQKDSKYLLLQYKNYDSIEFNEFIHTLEKNELLLHIIQSFRSFLQISQILLQMDLQHLYLTSDSLLYLKRENRYIFGNMDQVIDSKESLLLFTKKFFTKKTIWPLELHLLSYIQERKLESISHSNIEEVYDLTVGSLNPSIKSSIIELKESTINSLEPLINQPRERIVSWIYEQRHTWNLYSLSVSYLEIILNLKVHNNIGEHPFLSSFSLFLIQQTFFKRENIDTFHKKWEELLYSITEIEWNN